MPDIQNLEILISTNATVNPLSLTPFERGTLVHDVVSGMQQTARMMDSGWIKLGAYWSFIIKNKLYKFYGDHVRNANDFLREIDIGLSRRELDRYGQMAALFGRHLRNRQIPIRKLSVIAPLCITSDATEEWLNKAELLPQGGLEDEIREYRGQTPRDVCTHPEGQIEIWSRCKHCGKWLELIRQ